MLIAVRITYLICVCVCNSVIVCANAKLSILRPKCPPHKYHPLHRHLATNHRVSITLHGDNFSSKTNGFLDASCECARANLLFVAYVDILFLHLSKSSCIENTKLLELTG